MNTPQITIKTTPKAKQLLRLIAAHTGEKQYQALERLLSRELTKLQKAHSSYAQDLQVSSLHH
jgi:hypothetical protein